VVLQRSSRACDGTEEVAFRYATFHRCSKFEWLPVANEENEKEQKSRTLKLAPSVQKNSIGFVAQRTPSVHVLHCLHSNSIRQHQQQQRELVHRTYMLFDLDCFLFTPAPVSRGFFSDRQTLADWQIVAAVHHRPTTHHAAQRRSRNDQTQGGAPVTHPKMQGKGIAHLILYSQIQIK